MNPRLLLPLGLTAMMGVGIFFIPSVRDGEELKTTAPKRPQVMRIDGVIGAVPKSSHAERKAEPKSSLTPPTPEEEEQSSAQRALELSKMFIRYMTEHAGLMPPDTSALVATGLMDPGRTGELLRDVIEYRGAEMTSSGDARLMVLRYRVGKRTDKELRVHLSGAVRFCDPAEPIPEDAVEESQIPK